MEPEERRHHGDHPTPLVLGIWSPLAVGDVFATRVDVGPTPQITGAAAVGTRPEPIVEFALVAGAGPDPIGRAHLVQLVDRIGRNAGRAPVGVRPEPARHIDGHSVPAIALRWRAAVVGARFALE